MTRTFAEPLGVVVVGAGVIGRLHARILTQLPRARLVALAEQDAGRRTQLAAEFGMPIVGGWREALAQPGCGAVSLCLPEPDHVAAAVAAAEAGKHLLVEKPLATSTDDGRRIIDACHMSGVMLMVAHVLRFDPRYAGLQAAVARGELGDLTYLYARRNNRRTDARRLGGRTDSLFYLAVHDLDLMNWVAGAPVRSVYAQGVKGILADLGVEDVIAALIRYENGVVGTLELAWNLPEDYPTAIDACFEAIGTAGRAEVRVAEQGLVIHGREGERFPDTLHWPEVNGRIVGDLRDELEAFVDCVLDGTEVPVSPEAGLAAVAVAETIRRSLRTGLPVELA